MSQLDLLDATDDPGGHLADWDWICVSSSAGKDSLATLDLVAEQAACQGVLDRVVVIHADLGRMEWAGTRQLAEAQARAYDVRFEVCQHRLTLLEYVLRRGKWPSPQQRWCTSDLKRGPIQTVFTRLVAERRPAGGRVRLLNVMGLRAQESPARARKEPVALNQRASNGRREVTDWLPIHDWSEQRVWERIQASTIAARHVHPTYAVGMPRLSCVFCIYAPHGALTIAARHNPALAAEYLAVERATGHTFRHGYSLAEAVSAAAADAPVDVSGWVG